MDVAFPYKEAITKTYGLIDHTTTHVASRSLLYPRVKDPEEKPKVNHPYLMVKQVFQAVHFDKPFNQIVEEAAEWK